MALEVGTKGILGGVAEVEGVEGTWRELTTNVSVGKARRGGNLQADVHSLKTPDQVNVGVVMAVHLSFAQECS